jgi:hypothetical protein
MDTLGTQAAHYGWEALHLLLDSLSVFVSAESLTSHESLGNLTFEKP